MLIGESPSPFSVCLPHIDHNGRYMMRFREEINGNKVWVADKIGDHPFGEYSQQFHMAAHVMFHILAILDGEVRYHGFAPEACKNWPSSRDLQRLGGVHQCGRIPSPPADGQIGDWLSASEVPVKSSAGETVISPQQAVAIASMMLDRAHHTHCHGGKEWLQFFSGAREVGATGLTNGQDLSKHCHRHALSALGIINEHGTVDMDKTHPAEGCWHNLTANDSRDGARDAG